MSLYHIELFEPAELSDIEEQSMPGSEGEYLTHDKKREAKQLEQTEREMIKAYLFKRLGLMKEATDPLPYVKQKT